MGKKLILLAILLSFVAVAFAEENTLPINHAMLIELTMEKDVCDGQDTLGPVLELTLPSPGFVMITQDADPVEGGGGSTWWVLDGDSLGQTFRYYECVCRTLTTYLDTGEHSIHLGVKVRYGIGTGSMVMENILFTALVFYQDQSSVCEGQSDPPAEPEEMESIVSRGPSIHVPQVTKVVDIAGKQVDCDISGEEVRIGELPSGTYFAYSATGVKTKIVKP